MKEAEMIPRKSIIVLAAAVALLSLSCQGTEDSAPAPGPIVDLIPKPLNNAVFAWRLNAGEVDEEILVADEISVFDNGCLVRNDLIGKKTTEFEFLDKDGVAVEYPGVIKLESTDGSITMSISYLGPKKGLSWMVVQHTSPMRSCSVEGGPITAGLPVEFDNLDVAKLFELHSGEDAGSNIKPKVDY